MFSVDYYLDNDNPKIFDNVEFFLRFKTQLQQELKLKTVSLIFNNPDRNKVNFEN